MLSCLSEWIHLYGMKSFIYNPYIGSPALLSYIFFVFEIHLMEIVPF